MKRIITYISLSLLGITAFAQGEFDALKYNQTDIAGTARYMGMAGAFGALGGDASSISINPAGLGVYRSSELSLSTGLVNTVVNSNMNSVSSSDNSYKVPFNNLSLIINFGGKKDKSKGIVNSSLGLTFNKLKNFNRNVYIKGGLHNTSMTDYLRDFTRNNSAILTATDLNYVDSTQYEPFNEVFIPWLSVLGFETYLIDTIGGNDSWRSILNDGEMVSPSYLLSEKGYVNEFSISYAANISNKLYVGASLGFVGIDYTSSSSYSEDFESFNDGFTLNNHFNTSGSGINFKLGTIFRPVNFLRIGASISTPTFYSLTDTYSANLESKITFASSNSYYSETPLGGAESYYELQGPMKVNGSLAFILGKAGIISMDYGFTNYTSMKLREEVVYDDLGYVSGSNNSFTAENDGMNKYLLNTHSFKIGTEIKVNDHFSLRAGYGFVTPATDNSDATKELPENTTRTDPEYFLDGSTTLVGNIKKSTDYYSAGFGFRDANWFLDFAYLLKNYKQEFYPYNLQGAPMANVNTLTNNFIATFGIKF